jgi:hypothetical protein
MPSKCGTRYFTDQERVCKTSAFQLKSVDAPQLTVMLLTSAWSLPATLAMLDQANSEFAANHDQLDAYLREAHRWQ